MWNATELILSASTPGFHTPPVGLWRSGPAHESLIEKLAIIAEDTLATG